MRHITPQQNAAMRLRTRLLAAVLAAGCLGGLAVRLAVLMLCDPGGYAARAADQQLRGATLPAARGEIYSADGTLLAASETCWTIRAAPREMADADVEPAARALSEILELDYADTLAKFSQRTPMTACCAAVWGAKWPMPSATGAGKTASAVCRYGRTQSVSTRKGALWAEYWALPMWTMPGCGGWSCATMTS